MEESISSSWTAGASSFYGDLDCYDASAGLHAPAEASEDSGWTAYFYDDDGADNCLQLQASQEESAPPAPREKHSRWLAHGHGQGDRASASTVSTASKSKVKARKKVTKGDKKKRPRWESAGEDPLQDTASSLPANAAPQVQQQDGWQIAGCCDQRSVDRMLQETQMGLPGARGAGLRKEGLFV